MTDFQGTGAMVMKPDEAAEADVFFQIGLEHNLQVQREEREKLPERYFRPVPVDQYAYRRAFDRVMHHLKRGDTYLLNLTFPTLVETDYSPEELFRYSTAPFKLLVQNRVVVFSPEPFLLMDHTMIRSFPMKGTIDASLPDAAAFLLADKKEAYEHNTIVDLIRNDLSMIATGVKVERFRYLERIRTNRNELLQMSSEISGKLPAGHWHKLGENLFHLLPAGSVSGAPKERTVQIILETENYERGLYTGVFGYFDGSALQSAVMIRFIEFSEGSVWFKSGGGITALSDPEKEYQELSDKVYVPFV